MNNLPEDEDESDEETEEEEEVLTRTKPNQPRNPNLAPPPLDPPASRSPDQWTLLPWPQWPPPPLRSPHTNRFIRHLETAFTLANRLGVKPTIETLKRLEFVEQTVDPRPAKRQRKVVNPEEEIDLTWTSDEDAPMNDAAGPSQRYESNITKSSSANASSAESTIALRYSLLPLSTDMDLVDSMKCFVLSEREQVNREEKVEWMLDSGASRHFTNTLDDFVEYEELKQSLIVQTANSSTRAIGQGTVILLTEGRYVRISPVFYIPDLGNSIIISWPIPKKRTLYQGECSLNHLTNKG
jgi:hypothetical protein